MQEIELNGESRNITQDNIDKLKQIFPEVFNENKIDFDKLQAVLGENIDTEDEKYRFTWNGKMNALRLSQTPSTGTLRPCKADSVEWDTTQNLYIEGDNLEVLKLLQNSYLNKIKMIYIDPPYNTGNDFVYKDDFKDNIENYKKITGQVDSDGNAISTNSDSSGRYHTNWLNMMYPRLKLARNLLSDDGMIFISIDDNEVNNLRKICDEIFGENNCQGLFVVNSTPNARDYGHIGKMHEFVLFYSKNSYCATTNMLPDEGKNFKYTDAVGGYNIHPLYNSNEAFTPKNRPNLFYPFYLYLDKPISDDFYEIGLSKHENSIELYPPKSLKNGVQFVWRWGKDKSSQNINKEIIGYKTAENEYRIVQKMRHSEKIIRSLLLDKSYSSRRGTAELEQLLNGKVFSFPKPVNLIKDLVKVATNENSIILDFFSGAATTAHAIMQLNSEDNGNRKFICVQLPEQTDEKSEAFKAGYKNICEIGKERIRRAEEKIKQEIEQENQQLKLGEEPKKVPDIGFKVFKLDSSNIKKWNPDTKDLEQTLLDQINNYVDGRTEEDALYEIILKCGLDLTVPVEELNIQGKKVYSVGMGALIVCLDNDITLEVANEIAKLDTVFEDKQNVTVVFKDNGFKDDSVKTNIKETIRGYGIGKFVTI